MEKDKAPIPISRGSFFEMEISEEVVLCGWWMCMHASCQEPYVS